jgi:ribose/xylose/arabinose/galactoside ABC-type transport system permease subunit
MNKERDIRKILYKQRLIIGLRPLLFLLTALIVLTIVMSFIAPYFFTPGNLTDILRVSSIKGIMSVGMTLVLLTGGIDLSVGSIFAVSGAIAASLVVGGYSDYPTSSFLKLPVILAVLTALIASGVLGFINGTIITRLNVEPFITTLAMMTFARGLTYLYTGGYPINFKPIPDTFAWFGKGYVGLLPTPTVLFLLVALLMMYVLSYTEFGRSLYAIGGNREAATLSGLRVKYNITKVYTIMGVLSGLAGVVMTSRVAAAAASAGEGYEMDVIASVVLGGTIQSGGKGSIAGTIIGILIFGVIENGMNILGMPTYYKLLIKGAVIIVALGYPTISTQRKGTKAT